MAKKIQNPDKKKAWDAFSRYVRVRDCLATTGLAFVGVCVTCEPPRRLRIRYLQAGHFLPGRSNAILIDEDGVNAQCRYCNEVMNGRLKRYRKIMIKRHGLKRVKQMEIDARKVKKYIDFKELEKEYKEKYINLMRLNGFKTWSQLLKEGK